MDAITDIFSAIFDLLKMGWGESMEQHVIFLVLLGLFLYGNNKREEQKEALRRLNNKLKAEGVKD